MVKQKLYSIFECSFFDFNATLFEFDCISDRFSTDANLLTKTKEVLTMKYRYVLLTALVTLLTISASAAFTPPMIEDIKEYSNGSYWQVLFNSDEELDAFESIDILMAEGFTQDLIDMERVATWKITQSFIDSASRGGRQYGVFGLAPKGAFSGKRTFLLRFNYSSESSTDSRYYQRDWDSGKSLNVSINHDEIGLIDRKHVSQLGFNFSYSEVELLQWNGADYSATYEESTGRVTWTPKEAGEYIFTATFARKGNNNNSESFTWVVHVGNCKEPGRNIFVISGIDSARHGLFIPEFVSPNIRKQLITSGQWANELFITTYENEPYVIKTTYYDPVNNNATAGYVLSEKGAFIITPDRAIATQFKVSCGETDSTWINFKEDTKFAIVSNPGKNGVVDQEYVYEPVASKYDASDLVWDFEKLPKGAKMEDGTTGRITFTPEEAGEYEFAIICSNINTNEVVSQEWVVRVSNCAFNGSLFLSMQDNGQNVLPPIHVFDKKGDYIRSEQYPAFGLDKGEYIIGIEIPGYALSNNRERTYLYSGNVYDIKKAETIEIACGDTTEYKWDLTGLLPKGVNVTGKIYDTDTENPLMGYVEFVCVEGIFKGRSAATYSREQHGYEMKLPSGQKWVARAYSAFDSTNWTDRYHLGYYGGSDNFFDAEIIELENGKTIDIGLMVAEDQSASISGNVTDKDNNSIEGVVITAYMVEAVKGYESFLYNAYSARTDSDGNYTLENLMPGEYVVHAWASGYLGGYWKGQSEKVVIEWLKAKDVEVEEDEETSGIDFTLQVRDKNNGNCRVRGNTRNEGGLVQTEDNPQEDNAVTGVFITVIDMDGNSIATSYSDYMGDFDIEGLAVGSYDIIADKPGYESISSGFTLAEEGDVADVDLAVLPWQSVSDLISAGYSIYPNPSDISATIAGFHSTDISVAIYDVTGTRYITDYTLSAGTVELSTNNLPAGQFIIIVNDGGKSYQGVLIVK